MSSPHPVFTGGADDAGGRDPVAGDVAGAMAVAAARRAELESDTFGQGSTIGDLLGLPPTPDEASKHTGGPDTGYPA